MSLTSPTQTENRSEAWSDEVRFAMDSPLGGAGFEPSVPGLAQLSRLMHAKRCEDIVETAGILPSPEQARSLFGPCRFGFYFDKIVSKTRLKTLGEVARPHYRI